MEIPFHQSNREKTKDDIRIKVLNVIPIISKKNFFMDVLTSDEIFWVEEAQSYQKLEINEVNNQIVSGSGLRLRRPAMTWRPGLVSGLCAVSGFTVVCSLINQVRIKHYTTCSDELSQTDNHITSSNVRTWFVPSHSEHLHCLTKLFMWQYAYWGPAKKGKVVQ